MTDDQHAEGTPGSGGRWDPLPQGEYDDGATAFVKLPEGGIDALRAADSPLAAPGHGYVPPRITAASAPPAAADPAATGEWTVPGAPAAGAHWPDPNAVPRDGDGDADDRFTYHPGATQQWNFHETQGQHDTQAGRPAPGHDVTGQWSIPVAGGELPDESGEFTTSSLVQQWGGTPPATLPGGAAAPWAAQPAGQPWDGPRHDPAGTGHDGGPATEAYEPAADTYDHSAEAYEPATDTYDHSAEAYEPATDTYDPAAEAYRAEPPTADAGPDAGHPAARAPHAPEHAGHIESEYTEGAEHAGHIESEYTERAEHAGHIESEYTERAEHAGLGTDATGAADPESGTARAGTQEPGPARAGTPRAGAPEAALARPGAPDVDEARPAVGPGAEPAHHPDHAEGAPAETAEVPAEPAEASADTAPAEGTGPAPRPAEEPATAPEDRAPEPTAPEDRAPEPTAPEAAPDADAGTVPRADAATVPDPGPGTAPHADLGTVPDTAAETVPDTDAEAARQDPAPQDDPPPAPPQDEHPLASFVLRVNGADRPVTDAWIGESLLYVLRERLGLAGAKDGCSQGECGACNVQVDGRLVASCLVPAVTAAGSEVRTVEGLAVDGQPSDVQRALARCGAVQCGFCVPGMAMTVHDLLEGNPEPTELETRQALCGNLCRCSGYRGVLDAVREVVAERAADTAGEAAEPPADEPRIPHQAGPGAGGIHPSAFDSPEQHDPYGQDGGQA
ncbi:2Fe-2S iron-sulfur cluster-binding protein [Streptomyces sp. NPDC015220]|uniref:2Fe-2S iron-sulfur cluster-binding protein n=1 Tax=Streptomyces sp. NPDC015220 TaxID=3364947 RepID=UPI0036F6DA3D